MNALLKKEIRLLLPNFVIAGALTATLLFLPQNSPYPEDGVFRLMLQAGPLIFCPLMVLALALSSFGGEVSAGTFALLLAQPVSRQKIWDTKISVLAFSLGLLGFLWSVFAVAHAWMGVWVGSPFSWLLDAVAGAVIFLLAVFSGGLWTVLLLRHVAAAFWLTILIPCALLIVSGGLLADCDENLAAGIQVIVMGLYSLAGFFLARRLFFRAQDLAWTGGAVVLPEMRGWAQFRAGGLRRAWRPKMALLGKELQLHQAQYVVAVILAVLNSGALAIRHWGHFRMNSDTLFVLENVFMVWLVLPLLLGCAAVAEERKLGTLAGQVCLPVQRRSQFLIKALVVLGGSLVFGVGMPLLFHVAPEGDDFLKMLSIMAVTIGGVAFYVSTLTRNLLQTLAPAIVGVALAGSLLVIAPNPWEWHCDNDFLWHGPVVYLIALPIIMATLLVLAFRNFHCVQITQQQVGGNLLALTGALAVGTLATAAVYHRAWEKFTPFEPSHGPARLSLSAPPRLSCQRQEVMVRLPGGQIWSAAFAYPRSNTNRMTVLFSNFKFTLRQERQDNGSNWVSLVCAPTGLVGIQTDGTLWLSENAARPDRDGQWHGKSDYSQPLVQFGAESNWSSAAPASDGVWLMKTDGTLWTWNPQDFDYAHTPWPGLHAFSPRRLGAESNWSCVQEPHYQPVLSKTDGSVWCQLPETNGQRLLEIEPGLLVAAERERGPGEFRSTSLLALDAQFRVGVRDDGTFRAYAEGPWVDPGKGKPGHREWRAVDLPIGNGTNWLAVAGWWNHLVTLRADGTLWLWPFQSQRRPGFRWGERYELAERAVQNEVPVRLGTHADWVAIAHAGDNLVSLAADGSLWYWPLSPVTPYYGDNNQRTDPLLDISHKPRLLGNIFDTDKHK